VEGAADLADAVAAVAFEVGGGGPAGGEAAMEGGEEGVLEGGVMLVWGSVGCG